MFIDFRKKGGEHLSSSLENDITKHLKNYEEPHTIFISSPSHEALNA